MKVEAGRLLDELDALLIEASRGGVAVMGVHAPAPQVLVSEGTRFLRLFDIEGYAIAVSQFLQALAKAPDYAPAHAGLAEAYAFWGLRRETGRQEGRSFHRLAYEHAGRALALAPDRPEAHRAMAIALRRGVHGGAARRRTEILRALKLDAGDAHSWYERWCAFGWRLEDDSITRALALDPGHVAAHIDLGVALCDEQRFTEAVEHLTEAVRLAPRNSLAYYDLAIALDRLGRKEQSVQALLKAQGLYLDDPLIANAIVLPGENAAAHV